MRCDCSEKFAISVPMSERSPLPGREAGREREKDSSVFVGCMLNKGSRLRKSCGLHARTMRTKVRECTRISQRCEYSSFYAHQLQIDMQCFFSFNKKWTMSIQVVIYSEHGIVSRMFFMFRKFVSGYVQELLNPLEYVFDMFYH